MHRLMAKIISSDEDVETFYKLITNLIIQQSYKQLKNDSYIEPEVIVNMIHNNIASHNDFPKSAYDYEGLNKIEINNDQLSATAESLIGYRVRDEANKLENKFNEFTYSGKNGNYMVFLNANDQIFELRDNEERTLLLVFTYFIDSCKNYQVNPYRMLRAIKKAIFSSKKRLIAKVENKEYNVIKLRY